MRPDHVCRDRPLEPVDGDGALLVVVEAEEHVEQAALPGAIRPDNADAVAARDVQVESAQQRAAAVEADDITQPATGNAADGAHQAVPQRLVGIGDRQDLCPDRPEDFDGFEDEDGCPDRDDLAPREDDRAAPPQSPPAGAPAAEPAPDGEADPGADDSPGDSPEDSSKEN